MYDPDSLIALEERVRKALPRWALGPVSEVKLINVSENATFLVTDGETGRELVLRVHRPGYHTRQEIASEISWIEALRADRVVDTPAPVAGVDGEVIQELPGGPARHAVAFERVSGAEPAATEELTPWFRELGGVTARMHLHARIWRRPPGFARKVWNFSTALGPEPHWGPWRQGLGLEPAGTALLERAVATIERRVARFGQSRERFGLVHADLRLANLLVDGPRLNVIDFDDCGLSWFVYDFAAAITFIEHEPIVPALLEAWVAGYRQITSLSAEDAAEIPVMVMLRRILILAWIASHAETPTAQQMGVNYTVQTLGMAETFLGRYA
jgi:Ser/Thr protein kinase RdoA (MazF antagonist)